MASIKEVARKANVGVGTVSRVLNSTGYVSDETRKKVEEAMKELNYIPNELARNLLSKKSGIVAIIIPKISHPFFAEIVLYAEAELMKKGYKTMICSTYSEQNYEKEYLNMLNRHIVDGIIAGSHMLDLEEYQNVRGPIVAVDRFLGENIPIISTNHKIGGRLAAEELLRNGCRCVLQIQGARVVDSPSHERHYEFERYMKKHGVTVYSYEMDWNDFDYGQYDAMAEQLMDKFPDVDGIFAVDMVAIACIRQLLKRKKKIPRDVKIVAYDGTYVAKVGVMNLTVVQQPIEKLTNRAVHVLINMIQGKEYRNKKIFYEPTLLLGDTTYDKE
nr:LacI family DNA-binding transcriptional regulator [uncultured Blautia sp.]